MAALSPDPESYIQSILDTDLYKLRSVPPLLPRPALELTPLARSQHVRRPLSPPPRSRTRMNADTSSAHATPRQYAILELYPDVDVKYRFTNRGGTRFTRDMHAAVLKAIQRAPPRSPPPPPPCREPD